MQGRHRRPRSVRGAAPRPRAHVWPGPSRNPGGAEELAYWTGCAGDAAAAREQFAALLPSYEDVLGPEHPETLALWYQLATGLRWRGIRPPRGLVGRLLPVRRRPPCAAHGLSQACRPQGAGGEVDDEGDGDAVCEGDGDGEPERDGVGDFDGRDENDVECDGAGEVADSRDDTVWTGVGT